MRGYARLATQTTRLPQRRPGVSRAFALHNHLEPGHDADEDEIENLVETLALEPIEVNLFRGTHLGRDGPRIFGGQVIAQALLAAYETVEDRVCHSIHCYFIRPGDPSDPDPLRGRPRPRRRAASPPGG